MTNHTKQSSSVSLTIDNSLLPKDNKDRTMNCFTYAFMWIGDGMNLGNMTLGASLVVAGVATMNILQTFVATFIAILIISTIFVFNDRLGYRTGIPYVVQLRMSFGIKGAIISSLLRGIPAIVWYGFQSWIGATALNEIIKILSNGEFNQVFVCFLILQFFQIILSLYGFHAIKWVETLISVVILCALIYVFIIVLNNHQAIIIDKWVKPEGTWGLPFYGFIMMFLGNYAAIFLSAADYSRELKSGFSNRKRGLLYFLPIFIAYGFIITIGVMLASVTGNSNPVKAFAIVVDNAYITLVVSTFIVLGTIAVNIVANIIPPAYVITLLTKANYKLAVTITGLLAIASFPWILVQDTSAQGLGLFILIYSAFLGPIVAILLVEYYLLRRQQININALYDNKGQFAGYNPAAILAMLIGSAAAFYEVSLSWVVGFFVGGISYILLTKYAFKQSLFKKGTIFEKR
ncbi:NCS1 family transporter [Gilliamella apicola]|uniref:Allantoin permease n=1 Tax=Gilliamella apicola TaxID=1196095 RepID=A0A242NFS8_9GAMM|nr:NCS1 family transporter [Gilliamella apicola]OTP82826.1 allantoin permease [Gilliamella apicola]OTP85040.1 allantoin permease [Gilliamella apicola]OTP90782.1 allantoin permease [Gilliamella apicola]OTP98704.1 allantoin permease [Gilliamella apicola]OTQ09611.1 allantoin permease [Gilliamella apicola]